MNLDDYQRDARKTSITDDEEVFFLGLVGEVGSIFSAYKKIKRGKTDGERARVELVEELGDALWYLAAIAGHYNIPLSRVASVNLSKTSDFFIGDPDRFFDAKFPAGEQLPRLIDALFTPIKSHPGRVEISVNGKTFGAVLDDNALQPDGYRYHDVFHFSYATFLHWSPVLRDLLEVKRKSDKAIDDAEDGARAAAIEEAISAFVFAEHKRVGGFDTAEDIPFRTLETIKRITADLEVGTRTIQEWQQAIAVGMRAFEQLKQNEGGRVRADLTKRRLKVTKR